MPRTYLLVAVLLAAILSSSASGDGYSYERVTTWGDSLTYGVNMADGLSYPEQLAAISGREVENRGVNSYTTANILYDMNKAEGHDGVSVIWAGRNNIKTMDDEAALVDIAAMVDLAEDGKFLVLSVINAASEPGGTPSQEWVRSLNDRLAAQYGNRYLDVLTPLIHSGVGGEDEEAADIIPRALRIDDLHLNAEGYRIVAETVSEKLMALGY